MRLPLRLFAPVAFASLGLVAGCASSQSDPPGTAAGRALDRVAGTNTSGAYPAQSDGMPGNPPGTAVGRTVDRVAGTNTAAPPQPAARSTRNLPGTAAQRAYDRRMGTNTSGAYPRNRRVVDGGNAQAVPAGATQPVVPAPGRNPSPRTESGSGNTLVQPGQVVTPSR